MTATLIAEWETSVDVEQSPKFSRDVYEHRRAVWEGDTEEETLAAARAWCWEKIGERQAFIREPPKAELNYDYDTKESAWRAHPRISVCVRRAEDAFAVGFGAMG